MAPARRGPWIFRLRKRRRTTRTAESTRGGGLNAWRGRARPVAKRNRRVVPGLYLRTTARCSTRSADIRLLPGASSIRTRPAEIPYGGLATTRNGRPGKRSDAASADTTVTCGNRSRNTRTRPAFSSTAITRAPARTRCAVSAPSPAPMSSTNSPRRTPAAATTRAAQSSASRCQPHARRDRPMAADTTDHHREDTHPPTVLPPVTSGNSLSERRWLNVLACGLRRRR